MRQASVSIDRERTPFPRSTTVSGEWTCGPDLASPKSAHHVASELLVQQSMLLGALLIKTADPDRSVQVSQCSLYKPEGYTAGFDPICESMYLQPLLQIPSRSHLLGERTSRCMCLLQPGP